jgi:TRAP-type mannitol/chloroaromatic compound transport system permease large subunit
MLIPWLKKLGYPAPFAAGTLAAAATIDILIPPVDPDDRLRAVSGASIGALFVAGILPGLPDVRRLHGGVLRAGPAPQLPARHRRRSSGPRSGASSRTPARP